MHAAIGGAEVGVFQCIIDGVFVFFGYVENKWTQPCVFVGVVLPPSGCAAEGYDYALCCFADFYG